MTIQPPSDLNRLEIAPEKQGAQYWYERYCEQRFEVEGLKQRVKELEEQFESLNENLRKLNERTSETSSQPPSSDGPKKPNRNQHKAQRKRGPQYNHTGTTGNGFGWIDHTVLLEVQKGVSKGWGSLRRLVVSLKEVWVFQLLLSGCAPVVILSAEDEAAIISQRFRDLFRVTQALPDVADITDDDILTEIATYRRGA